MATFGRGMLTYLLTVGIFCMLLFTWLFFQDGTQEWYLLPVFVGLMTVLLLVWALLPTFVIWGCSLLILLPTGLRGRWRAVISAAPTAYLGAWISSYAFVEAFRSMGASGSLGTVEHLLVTVLAPVVAYAVWTALPEEPQSHE